MKRMFGIPLCLATGSLVAFGKWSPDAFDADESAKSTCVFARRNSVSVSLNSGVETKPSWNCFLA